MVGAGHVESIVTLLHPNPAVRTPVYLGAVRGLQSRHQRPVEGGSAVDEVKILSDGRRKEQKVLRAGTCRGAAN